MYRLPRDHEAIAAIRQQAMEKANAMCSPVWNGPEIRLGKKLRPVSARALAGGSWLSSFDPTRCPTGL